MQKLKERETEDREYLEIELSLLLQMTARMEEELKSIFETDE